MWPRPPIAVIVAADRAAHQRRAAAGERAVVGQRLGKAHGNAGADRGGHADQKRLPGVVGGERRGKQRRQRRDRAVHQPGQPRLHVLQHEHPPRGLVLLGARALGQDLLAELVGEALVLGFDLGELDRGAGGSRRRASFRAALPVEARPPRTPWSRRICAPRRGRAAASARAACLLDEALDVLAADQRQVVAEFRAIQVEQHGAVAHLLVGHLVEHLGRCRVTARASPRRSRDRCGCPRPRW